MASRDDAPQQQAQLLRRKRRAAGGRAQGVEEIDGLVRSASGSKYLTFAW
jgi:hypothetical protein